MKKYVSALFLLSFLFIPLSLTLLFTPMDNALYYTFISTEDGFNQNVHPDVLYFENEWSDWKYWMCTTPYPGSDNYYENPSIYVCDINCTSNDAIWRLPHRIENPISGFPLFGEFNSDCDIVYNEDTDELWVYYRHVSGHVDDRILSLYLQKSSDGIHWDNKTILYTVNGKAEFLSPSIIKKGNNWTMWYVNTSSFNAIFQLTSEDGLNWSNPTGVNFTSYYNGSNIIKPWHLDVIWVPEKEEYWMVYPGQKRDLPISVNNDIYFANSSDGLNWIEYNEKPIILKNLTSEWENHLYRSTMIYDEITDNFYVWYSAAGNISSSEFFWQTGYTGKKYEDLKKYLTNYTSSVVDDKPIVRRTKLDFFRF